MAFWNKNKHEFSLVLDIGSASVGVALIEVKANSKKPTLHSTVRVPVALSEKPTFDVFLPKIIGFLEKALLLKLKKKKVASIKNAYCFYASPWYDANTNKVQIHKSYPVEITKHFIENILSDEKKNFLEGVSSDEDYFTEQKVIDVRLNGYKTNAPIGKKAMDIDMSVFLSAIPKRVVDSVEKMIEKHLHVKHIYHHSFPLASYSSLIDIFPLENTFAVIDVTGEITDMYFVRDDVLKTIHSFPSGRNLLIRKVAEAFDVSVELAVSYLDLYFSGDAEEKFNNQMEAATKSVKEEWDIYCKNGMGEICGDEPIPDKVFLMIDDDVRSMFKKIAESQIANIVSLDKETLKEFCECKNVVDTDPFLILESLFVHKMYY